MTNNKNVQPQDGLPSYFKWIMFGFIFVFVTSVITYGILLELRYPIVSIPEGNRLIAECKVTKIYEIGSPSQRRPNRVRTLLDLKDGKTVQTEYGTRLAVFQEAIDGIDCPLESKPLQDE